MSQQFFDLIVAGHFSIDSISLPNGANPYNMCGGAVTFVSHISTLLGAKTAIISKIGDDFPEEYLTRLKDEGIDLSGVKKAPGDVSTRFSLKYNHSLQNRKLRLISRTSPITINDLPPNFDSEIIHIAPIANEIQYDVIKSLRKTTNVLSLDPQGLLRDFNEKGYVLPGLPLEKRLLRMIDVYKSSHDEILIATGKKSLENSINSLHRLGVKIVIVTQGSLGSIISFEGCSYKIPAYPSTNIIDPTGAGDVFIGAFLTEYLNQEDTLWCASVGSAAASLIVESIGSTSFGDKHEICKRAQIIYEKEIKE